MCEQIKYYIYFLANKYMMKITFFIAALNPNMQDLIVFKRN